MPKRQYRIESSKGEIFTYNKKDIAVEVFEVLCTVSTGEERITLSENGKLLKEARI